MKYHIEVAEKYGKDQHYKMEMVITHGKSFSHAKARQKVDHLQKYSNSVKYKAVRN